MYSRFIVRCALLAALLVTQMGNAGGRAAVAGHGATGAPGENGQICITCHNGGAYGPLLELLEVSQGGQLVNTYTPGQTYDVRLTLMENAGNPAGYGFQLTALDNANVNAGTWQNLGNNVKQSAAANVGGRVYLEHKGGTSATGVFTARWVAPAAGTGDVDFYYNGAVVNGNNAQTGDNGGLGSSITLSEAQPGGLPLPYFDDFEFGAGGWMSYEDAGSQGSSSWQVGAPQGTVISSAASGTGAWVTSLAGSYANDELSYLESPAMDFSWAVDDPVINFAIHYDTESGMDGTWLELSTNGGMSWFPVGAAGTGQGWYDSSSAVYGDWWSGCSGGWVYASHVLEGAAGSFDVRVRFAFASDSGNAYEGVAIDDVAVEEAPPEDPPVEDPPPEDPPPEDPPPVEEDPLPAP